MCEQNPAKCYRQADPPQAVSELRFKRFGQDLSHQATAVIWAAGLGCGGIQGLYKVCWQRERDLLYRRFALYRRTGPKSRTASIFPSA